MWDLDQSVLQGFIEELQSIITDLEVLIGDSELPESCRKETMIMYEASRQVFKALHDPEWTKIEFGYWITPLASLIGFATILDNPDLRREVLISKHEALYRSVHQKASILFDEYKYYR